MLVKVETTARERLWLCPLFAIFAIMFSCYLASAAFRDQVSGPVSPDGKEAKLGRANSTCRRRKVYVFRFDMWNGLPFCVVDGEQQCEQRWLLGIEASCATLLIIEAHWKHAEPDN
jgi:hypothetical protein